MTSNENFKYLINERITFDEILSFMTSVDGDFSPSLLNRIDVNTYITKILTKATIVVCRCGKKIIGLIAFYDNDVILQEAYVTFLAVDALWRKHGIAFKLLEITNSIVKEKKMKGICVSTCNSNVVKFYQKADYIVSKTEYDTSANIDRFYLYRKL